ncbi:MAG: hypothetical protein DRI69_05290 [Bacteroidetes bacterium]|nr:MAG: hypothetical protein DRI69_05290 [Bacteroidota bacterium]
MYSNTIGHNNSAIGREALASNTEGERNTAMGRSALVSNIDGDENTAVGVDAMKLNTSGFKNTAVGRSALHQNTTGSNNVAIGRSALWYNETGSNNIAIGNEALSQNTDRSGLVAIGDSALFNNGLNTDFGNPIGAFFNTAIGSKALRSNETGAKNTAVGYSALYHCIDGGTNTAIGYNALYENIDGSANTAIGSAALTSNNDGDGNTAIGRTALATLENADHNTAIGAGAAGSSESGSNNVAVGYGALSYNTTGSMNTIVGAFAGESLFGLTSSRNVFIGYAAGRFENESDRLYIDNTSSTSPLIYGEFDNDLLKINGEFISSIPRSGLSNFVAKIENTKNNNTSRNEGLLIVAGHGIYNASNESSLLQFENPSGDYMGRIKQVGMTSIALITTSDQRLKHRISSTQYGLKDLMAIQVKDYYYQSDDSGTQETGFLAQQLYQHYPDAVDVGGEDVTKEPWGVAYGKLSPLLVKSIQDQQEIIQEQQEIIEHQDDRIAKLESQVSRLTKIFEQSRGKSCSEVKPDRH